MQYTDMTYSVSETIDNIDKILAYMKDCLGSVKLDIEKKKPFDLVSFASYSKLFFKEVNRLPDCFYGNEDNLLDIDEIIGLSTRSSYRYTTAIISGSSHAKKIAQDYFKKYEGLVEKSISYIK